MKRTWLFSLVTFLMTLGWASVAFAEGGTTAAAQGGWYWGAAIGAGLAIALGAFGGALAQGRAAAAALEGIARNPGAKGDVQTPMIIALAFIESLVIYALLIAYMLVSLLPKIAG